MKKVLIGGMAALALTAAAFGDAQQAWPREARRHERHQLSPEDLKVFIDTRVAAIKADLDLTPEQERHWPRLEQAIRDVTEARQERLEAWRERGATRDPVERMRDQADALTERAGDLRKLASAVEPLYKTLSEGQKRRLFTLMRITPVRLRHRGRWRRWR